MTIPTSTKYLGCGTERKSIGAEIEWGKRYQMPLRTNGRATEPFFPHQGDRKGARKTLPDPPPRATQASPPTSTPLPPLRMTPLPRPSGRSPLFFILTPIGRTPVVALENVWERLRCCE